MNDYGAYLERLQVRYRALPSGVCNTIWLILNPSFD
jgi:hypothetical protein